MGFNTLVRMIHPHPPKLILVPGLMFGADKVLLSVSTDCAIALKNGNLVCLQAVKGEKTVRSTGPLKNWGENCVGFFSLDPALSSAGKLSPQLLHR